MIDTDDEDDNDEEKDDDNDYYYFVCNFIPGSSSCPLALFPWHHSTDVMM